MTDDDNNNNNNNKVINKGTQETASFTQNLL